MINKVTFDRHTHLCSAGVKFEGLRRVVGRVWKGLEGKSFGVVVKEEGEGEGEGRCWRIENDEDLMIFEEYQRGSDNLFQLLVVEGKTEEVEEEKKEEGGKKEVGSQGNKDERLGEISEDSFTLLDQDGKNPSPPLSPRSSFSLSPPPPIPSLSSFLSSQLSSHLSTLHLEFQQKLNLMFSQHTRLSQSKITHKLFTLLTQTHPQISALLPAEIGPIESDILEGYRIPIFQEDYEGEDHDVEEEELINIIPSRVTGGTRAGGMEGYNGYDGFLDENHQNGVEMERFVYVNCKLCFRSLVHKQFYQCSICPQRYYCQTCKSAKLNCHPLQPTSYTETLDAKTLRTKPPTTGPTSLTTTNSSSSCVIPKKHARVNTNVTEEERIQGLATELEGEFPSLGRLFVLKFVRRNEKLELEELVEKLGGLVGLGRSGRRKEGGEND